MSKLADEVRKGEQHLQAHDEQLARLIKKQAPITMSPRDDYFFSLARSIICQQVSTAAARTIFSRLEEATDIDPQKMVELSVDDFRALGVSRQKAGYLHDLAQHFVDDLKVFTHLERLSDEKVIEELTSIKGIGEWTAQMFLMFTLVRLDVFAPADIGLQRAMQLLYEWDEVPPKAELEQHADKWRPYRTIACWHLWTSLENSPGF